MIKNIKQQIETWLSITGWISKTGIVFVMMALLLTAVSFGVGVPILMFVPAFVLSMLIYSLWDILAVRRLLRVQFVPRGDKVRDFMVRILFEGRRRYCYMYLACFTDDGVSLLRPDEQFQFVLPDKYEKLELVIQGRLDVFRLRVLIHDGVAQQENGSLGGAKMNGLNMHEQDFYFEVRPYRLGDSLFSIDAMRSSIGEGVFVREKVEIPMLNNREATADSKLIATSSEPLSLRSGLSNAIWWEWSMILLGFLGIWLQWGDIVFGLAGLGSMFFVVVWTTIWKKYLLSHFLMNTLALGIFGMTFLLISSGMSSVQAGAYFLFFLSVWKHICQRERRDGFTYIFLILFVFVALSLLSLRVWFFVLFVAYLFHAISLFSLYASGEKAEEYLLSFGFARSFRSVVLMNTIVVLSTLLLFFVLPHGEDQSQRNQFLNQSSAQTGFTDEVGFGDIHEVKQNFGKQFVVEQASEELVPFYESLYWRGMRFGYFDGKQWKAIPEQTVSFQPGKPLGQQGIQMNVKYYMDGEKHLFLPAVPQRLFPGSFQTSRLDSTIFTFDESQHTSVNVNMEFFVSPVETLHATSLPEIRDAFILKQFTTIGTDPAVSAMMLEFLETIPESFRSDPVALSRYIQQEAGFVYSLENPAIDLEGFLYGSQQGYCKFFASLLTLVLQEYGYEATLVNGFHGGEWNASANAWVVRKMHAHSWVELWDADNEKWIVLDPTPSISIDDAFWFESYPVLQSMIQYYDTLELFWYNTFVQYSREDQRQLFATLMRLFPFVVLSGGVGVLYWYSRKLTWFADWKKIRKRTPAEKFLMWLSKRTSISSFVLNDFVNVHPKLVKKTQVMCFGGEVVSKEEWRELKMEWRAMLENMKS